jgi:hypothetical protein
MENLVNFSGHASVDEVKRFCFGGHARFTLESGVSGRRYTFEITKKVYGDRVYWFAAVLTDGDQYTYIGRVINQISIRFTEKSRLSPDATAVKALLWFLRGLAVGRISESVTVYHSNRCGCCGRELTTPDSVRCGIGPVCRNAA